MINGMPWPAQLGVAGGGWALAFLLLVNFANGRWFVSRRENDSCVEARKAAEADRTDLIKAVLGTVGVGRLQQKISEIAIERELGVDKDEVG